MVEAMPLWFWECEPDATAVVADYLAAYLAANGGELWVETAGEWHGCGDGFEYHSYEFERQRIWPPRRGEN